MAVNRQDFTVSLILDSKGAVKGFKDANGAVVDFSKGTDQAAKTSRTLTERSRDLSIAIVGVNQALELARKAYRAIARTAQQAVNLFLEQDRVENQLRNTLRLLGRDVDGTASRLGQFASELQKVTTIGDETTLQFANLALAQRLTEDQTKDLILASTDLAAATGQNVQTAFDQLLRTFQGSPGRLNQIIKGMGDLTKEQLMAGDAIALVREQFEGFAQAEAQTLSGSLQQMRNSFGDLLEEISRLIVEVIDLPSIVQFLIKTFTDLQVVVNTLRENIMTLINAIAQIDFAKLATTASVASTAMIALMAAMNIGGVNTMIKRVVLLTRSIAVMGAKAAIAAIKFVAIGAAFLGIVATVDILVRNFNRLPQLFALIPIAFSNMKNRLVAFSSEMIASLLAHIRDLIDGYSVLGFIGRAAIAQIDEQITSLNATSAVARDRVSELNEELSAASDGIDFGIAGEFVKFFGNLLGDTKEEIVDIKDVTDDINFEKGIETSKEMLTVLRQISEENRNLSFEIDTFGATQEERIRAQLALDLERLEARRELLTLEGRMNAEISAALNEQASLIQQMANMRLAEIMPTTIRDVGKQIGATFKAVSTGITSTISSISSSLQNAGGEFSLSFEDAKAAAMAVGSSLDELARGAIDFVLDLDVADVAQAASASLSAAFSGVKFLFSPDQINALADTANSFKDLPGELTNSFTNLTGALDSLIEEFPAAFQELLNKLPEMISGVLDRLPEIINIVADALIGVFQKLPEIFGSILEKLPEILDAFFERLPEVIGAFIQAIPVIVAQLAQAIPNLIVQIAQNIDKIVLPLVEGLVAAVPTIVATLVDELIVKGGIIKIVLALVAAIPKVAVAFVKGVVNGLGKAFKNIFKGGLGFDKFIADMDSLPGKVADAAEGIKRQAQRVSQEIFGLVDIGQAKDSGPAKAIVEAMRQGSEVFVQVTRPWLTAIRERLIGAWNWLKDKVFAPVLALFRSLFNWVKTYVFDPITKVFRSIFNFVKENVFDPFARAIRSVFNWINDSVLVPFKNAINNTFNFVKENVFDPFADAIDSTFTFIKDKVFQPFINAINWFRDNVNIDMFKGLGKAIWEGLKDLIPSRLRSIVGLAQGGEVPNTLYANRGMFVPRGTDTVPAMLTPGEFVMSRGAVQSIGAQTLDTMNRTGQSPQGGTINNNFSERSIVIEGADQDPRDLVEALIRELERRSFDGQRILAASGVR